MAARWGNWWGNAANEFRRTKQRSTEEIGAVGSQRGRVTAVPEAKWTNTPLTAAIIADLTNYKIPALCQSGLKVVARPRIVLPSNTGYAKSLIDLLQSLDLGDSRVDLGLAVARQLPKFSDRWWWHEARTNHPMGSDVGEPLGIRQVGLAARNLLDVAGVAQPHGETAALQRTTGFQQTPVAPIATSSTCRPASRPTLPARQWW